MPRFSIAGAYFILGINMENNKRLSKKDTIKLIVIAAVALVVLCLFLVFLDKADHEKGELTFINVIKTMAISMIPIIELRGAIPIATASYHMSYAHAFLFAYIANCIVIAPVILLTRFIFDFLKKHIKFLRGIVEKYESRLMQKGEKAMKYAEIGLLLFVAIPIPGTGAWTGAMIAGLLGIRLKIATPIIAVGVLIAGILVMSVTRAVGLFV